MIPMSTENQVIEEAEVHETTEETTEEAKADAEQEAEEEPEPREELKWPGAKGEGEMRLHFFDFVGLPESLEDEPDPTRRLVLALIAEVQQLRVENHDLKAAVQYMTLETFIQRSGQGGASSRRPMPMAMGRIAGSK